MADTLLMIGAGNMGGAMLGRWLARGFDRRALTVVRPSGAPAGEGVRVVTRIADAPPHPATLVLAVKPQMLAAIADEARPLIGPGTLLVSILAGVGIATLRARFPEAGAVLRAMPNTPVAIGRGVVALHGDRLTADGRAAAAALFAPLGLVEWIEDEARFDLVTALTGSGPAFLFRFVDALAGGAAALGLPPDQALRLARATVDGAAGLAVADHEPPARLAERVASPGGSTRAGLAVLDADDALARLVRATLDAATRRNAELGRAAGG